MICTSEECAVHVRSVEGLRHRGSVSCSRQDLHLNSVLALGLQRIYSQRALILRDRFIVSVFRVLLCSVISQTRCVTHGGQDVCLGDERAVGAAVGHFDPGELESSDGRLSCALR